MTPFLTRIARLVCIDRRPRLVFFDLDGVLADDTHRVEYALARRWPDYFLPERMQADGVWAQGRKALLGEQRRGARIAYMTGRREDLRPVTEHWLIMHGFPEGELVMRPVEDRRRLAELKAALMADRVSSGQYRRVVLYDDDPEVVRVVRERLGFKAAVHCTWHVKQEALVRKEAV